MEKIIINLYRDETRTVQNHFVPYCQRYCITQMNVATTEDQRLVYMIVQSVFDQVIKQVKKKLLTEGRKFTFKFSLAEGIALYKLLINFPVPSDQIYMHNLRQRITDSINKQLATIETMMYEKEKSLSF